MNFSNTLKSNNKVSLSEAGMRYIANLGNGEHLLFDTEIRKFEVWFANKNHASFGLKWKNTHLEFARTMEQKEGIYTTAQWLKRYYTLH